MERDEVLERLRSLANPDAVAGMARYGIAAEQAFGVSMPELRKLGKEIGTDHKLAAQLWQAGIRETRILASIIDDPQLVTEEQMDGWAGDFDSWEICDQCCMNLFARTPFARRKCVEWSAREEEFVKRAAFALMARLAVSDKRAPDDIFEQFLPLIKREATDSRNMVKKGVSWALRQIGKRNLNLCAKAIATAEEMRRMNSRSARWIANDALRELTSEAVQERLRRKECR